jgi:hypothetical protein
MPVLVGCPQCGIKLDVPESFLGRQVRCASCQQVFEAKADPAPPASPLAAPPDNGPPSPRTDLQRWDEPAGRDEPWRDRWDEPRDRDRDRDRDRGRDRDRDRDRDRYADDDDDYDFRRSRRRRRDLQPHRAGLILTLGILSLVLPFTCGALGAVVGIVMGPIAWIMGTTDLRQIQAGNMDPDGQGNTRAGQVCGIIGTCISVLFMLGCALYLVLVVGMAASGVK